MEIYTSVFDSVYGLWLVTIFQRLEGSKEVLTVFMKIAVTASKEVSLSAKKVFVCKLRL